MCRLNACFVLGTAAVIFTGCPKPDLPGTNETAPKSSADSTETKESSEPKYQFEIVEAFDIGESKIGGVSRGVIARGEKWGKTQDTGDVKLWYEVEFIGHLEGADRYKVTTETTKGGVATTGSKEVSYAGERIELVVNEYGTVVMQPVSK